MRKITKLAVVAFYNGENFKLDNTEVKQYALINVMSLHGNEIARINRQTREVEVSNAGWFTPTTKERLNGVLGVLNNSVYQKKGVWYLNSSPWNGDWALVGKRS